MIRFQLICDKKHEFEGWFSSNADFDSQCDAGFVSCPICDSLTVQKRLMAPAVSTARSKQAQKTLAMDQTQKQAMAELKTMVETIKANSDDVGERFPEEARKIHYGEIEARGIVGKATQDEVKSLVDEGVEIAPLPDLGADKH